MSNFNKEAIANLDRVAKHFGKELTIYEPILCDYSIGIEVEIKFRDFFPELFEKYFKDRTWDTYSPCEQATISDEITVEEERLEIKERLEKITELGIKKGRDCYWEFALDPVTDLSIILTQLDLLSQLEVLPEGAHSLHVTIGNLKSNEETYWIFAFCELMFSSAERISSGFDLRKRMTFFKKGRAGLVVKRWRLVGCDSAVEFRSLELVVDGELSVTHDKLVFLNKLLTSKPFRDEAISRAKGTFKDLDLPNENWGSYSDNPEVWDRYANNYEVIKQMLEN